MVVEWIFYLLMIAVVSIPLIPAIILTRYHLYSEIVDYLIFAAVFYLSSVNAVLILITIMGETSLLLIQLLDTTFLVITFLLFLHIARIRWKTLNGIVIGGVLWFVLIQSMTVLYELSSDCSVIKIPPFTFYGISGPPCGIFKIGTTIIYGSHFLLLAEIYQLVILVYGCYLYGTADEIMTTKNIKTAKRLWVVAILLIALFPAVAIGAMVGIWEWSPLIVVGTNLLSFLLIAVVMIRYPEAVILTNIQLNRLISIQGYELMEDGDDGDTGIEQLNEYIEELKQMNLIKG